MNFVFIICLNNFAWTQQNLGRHEKIGGDTSSKCLSYLRVCVCSQLFSKQ